MNEKEIREAIKFARVSNASSQNSCMNVPWVRTFFNCASVCLEVLRMYEKECLCQTDDCSCHGYNKRLEEIQQLIKKER